MQAQIKDRLDLNFGHLVGAIVIHEIFRIINQGDERSNIPHRPAFGEQLFTGNRRVFGITDQGNHFVDIGNSHSQTSQHMGAVAGFVQFENCPARNDFFTELNEGRNNLAQQQSLRASMMKRQHIAGKRRLQRCEFEQLVQDHISIGITFQFNNNAHAVTVGFITNFCDAFNDFFTSDFAQTFQQLAFIDLIRDFMDDNGFAFVPNGFNRGFRAHRHRTASRRIGRVRPRTTQNLTTGRKVRPRNKAHQFFVGDIGVLHTCQTSVNDFAQIMWRNIGGHPHRDPARTIHQQVRYTGWQHNRFGKRFVIVGTKIDCVFINILQQGIGSL